MKPSEDARAGLRLPVIGWSSSGRPRVRGRPRPLHPRGAGCRGPTRGAGRAQGQPTRCRGPCGCGGTEGQRFGRAGHLIRHHGDSTGPASLRAASRVSRSPGGGKCELPGAVPGGRPAPGPHPCPQDRPGGFPARGLAQDCGQRGCGAQHAARQSAAVRRGGGLLPQTSPKYPCTEGPFPGAALCSPDTPSPRWALEAWTLCLPGAEDALRRDAPRGAHPSPFSLPGLRAPDTFPRPSLQRVNWVPLTGS